MFFSAKMTQFYNFLVEKKQAKEVVKNKLLKKIYKLYINLKLRKLHSLKGNFLFKINQPKYFKKQFLNYFTDQIIYVSFLKSSPFVTISFYTVFLLSNSLTY